MFFMKDEEKKAELSLRDFARWCLNGHQRRRCGTTGIFAFLPTKELKKKWYEEDLHYLYVEVLNFFQACSNLMHFVAFSTFISFPVASFGTRSFLPS